KIHHQVFEATHTTPDAIRLNRLLAQMVEEGCDFAFMEVSSHAISQDRIAGLEFGGGVFTNITHDHLDYHKTFRNYLQAKKKFFDNLPVNTFALSNADDKNGKVMLQNTRAQKATYGLKSMAQFKGRVLENHFDGLLMNIDGHEMHSLLSGKFNAYNLLAVYATAILLGMDNEEVLTAMSRLKGAEGRFELVRSGDNRTGIVDYAHTPDALKNVLQTINSIRTKNEQLITVVGAGGDRDKAKRPKMAHIASLLSTRVILTSDNPRSEDPDQILSEMRAGIDPAKTAKTMVISNREEAIKTAVNLAQSGDIILVAGKGHEKYQEIKGVKYPFDDKEILMQLLEVN
ncbi:MAG: UDP-N-acetylmuramoyl-L-alanyl-D-glutamate--2,6-diaminopimelate ligase, partial [bacterium]